MDGKRILFQNGFLRDVTLNDEAFIANLFSEPDVDFYYVRQPHHRNPKDFTSYMVASIKNKNGLYDVICSQDHTPVGLISAELLRDSTTEEICWNIGSAVLHDHRKKGFASIALMAYIHELSSFSINTVCLDISVDNISSIAVAKKCGFALRNRHGFIDPQHPEVTEESNRTFVIPDVVGYTVGGGLTNIRSNLSVGKGVHVDKFEDWLSKREKEVTITFGSSFPN